MPDQNISDSFEPLISVKPSARKPPSSRNNMRLFVSLLTLATILLATFAHRTPNAGQEEGINTSTAGPSLQPPTFKYNHAGFSVADLPAQIKWYSDILGFHKLVLNYTDLEPIIHTVQLMNSIGTVVELSKRANSTRLKADKIINPLERAVYQGIFHLALKVDDLNATYTYLGHRGVTLVAPPSCVDPYGCSAFVADPEENLIEIVHYTFD